MAVAMVETPARGKAGGGRQQKLTLGDKQQKVLRFIARVWQERGRSPLNREIVALLNRSAKSRNIENVLAPLVRKGLITRPASIKGRHLHLTEAGQRWLGENPPVEPELPLFDTPDTRPPAQP